MFLHSSTSLTSSRRWCAWLQNSTRQVIELSVQLHVCKSCCGRGQSSRIDGRLHLQLVIQAHRLVARPEDEIRSVARTALTHGHAVILVRLVPDAVVHDHPTASIGVVASPEDEVGTILRSPLADIEAVGLVGVQQDVVARDRPHELVGLAAAPQDDVGAVPDLALSDADAERGVYLELHALILEEELEGVVGAGPEHDVRAVHELASPHAHRVLRVCAVGDAVAFDVPLERRLPLACPQDDVGAIPGGTLADAHAIIRV
mmetsp:Transcript_58081/g.164759  ORF Transcript_58081/g.164759 Transcript_58081/m.164759 type:complete len:260 (+) Transcript_58081:304-1083(+)